MISRLHQVVVAGKRGFRLDDERAFRAAGKLRFSWDFDEDLQPVSAREAAGPRALVSGPVEPVSRHDGLSARKPGIGIARDPV